MQNEPNLPKAKMNVNKVLTRDYENIANWTLGENEPKRTQSKPICRMLKMNVTTFLTKAYENKLNWVLFENEPNTKPIQSQTKPISNATLLKWVITSEYS